ncbi:MAG TPA: lytic transglycosylase domain-containing protein [Pyrinomonadaceae bacterium]|jgi:soluble lytic murein transglycosylase-like protein|nr:lytic transglycosylase domain-containing protein [Pyrinomonadaceae bacterium]
MFVLLCVTASTVMAQSLSQHHEQCRVRLTNGMSIEVDDAWEDAQGIWYRRGGITNLLPRASVKTIERAQPSTQTETATAAVAPAAVGGKLLAKVVDTATAQSAEAAQPVWIYLVDGARVEADEVTETAGGAWYRRGTLSIFVERARIERIEREPLRPAAEQANAPATKARGWTTGNAKIDTLIRENGARHGVDPYLIFCVMEQESHFNPRVVSPKGARGLMQLMPGTGARFGVRNPFDPAQNISAGTRYMKDLLGQFNGRVDLVLASYNAGEGAVIKYGHNVPPYRETRDYVKRISARYGQGAHAVATAKAGVATVKPGAATAKAGATALATNSRLR